MDVSLRGAVSIARRLQDPLAELVKIDPKSIGVGQYQHDLAEAKLSRSLDAVVEDCVNAVGVDVNTASVPLLARVSGIGEGLAERHRRAPRRSTGRSAPATALTRGAAARAQGVRAVRRLPAHPRRRRPARRLQRAPRGLPGGPPHPGRGRRRPCPELIGNTAVLRTLRPAGLRRRPVRPADGHRHPARAGEAGPRPAPRVHHRVVRRGRGEAGGPARRA